MTDRLPEIKLQHNRGGYAHRIDCRVCWLIAEIDGLRNALAEIQSLELSTALNKYDVAYDIARAYLSEVERD